MKHSEVLNLKNKVSAVTGLTGFETKIAIRRNIAKMETAIKPLADEEKEIGESVKEYREEFNSLQRKLSGGKIKNQMQGGRMVEVFDIPTDKKAEFDTEAKILEEKHKEKIADYEHRIGSFKKFLEEEESSFEMIVIPLSQIKEYDEKISQENLDAIWPLIDESK